MTEPALLFPVTWPERSGPCRISGATDLAFLTPPDLKAKSRYLNLPPLAEWGQKTLKFLEHPRDLPGKLVDRKALEEKLGWLRDCRDALYHWSVLLAIAETAEHYVRHEG